MAFAGLGFGQGAFGQYATGGSVPAVEELVGNVLLGYQPSIAGVSPAGCIALDGTPHINTEARTLLLGGDLNIVGYLEIPDPGVVPSAQVGKTKIYIDPADGDLKAMFGDGTIKTIVTDT